MIDPHLGGIERVSREAEPDYPDVIGHRASCPSCVELRARVEAAEAKVATLTQERDEAVHGLQETTEALRGWAKYEHERTELKDRDRVLSNQLEKRAGGRDAFTQALMAKSEDMQTRAEAAESRLALLSAGVQQIERECRLMGKPIGHDIADRLHALMEPR